MMKLEISGLSFSYGERQVLEDISFGVAEGEFVSLLGPSGCGKSTVLKLLTGILSPDRGRILVDGEEIRGFQVFAYMPQNDLLFPWKTILDNVCLYGRIHGSLEEMRERAREYFPVFGLEGYEDSYPASLSGGMAPAGRLFENGPLPARTSFFWTSPLDPGCDHQGRKCRTGSWPEKGAGKNGGFW